MAVYRPKYIDPKTGAKRDADVWWCDFTYKGRRVRESTGQTNKTRAKGYEDRRRRELENAVAGVKAPAAEEHIRDLKSAVEDWVTVRSAGKKKRTKWFLRDRCAHLIRHLCRKAGLRRDAGRRSRVRRETRGRGRGGMLH